MENQINQNATLDTSAAPTSQPVVENVVSAPTDSTSSGKKKVVIIAVVLVVLLALATFLGSSFFASDEKAEEFLDSQPKTSENKTTDDSKSVGSVNSNDEYVNTTEKFRLKVLSGWSVNEESGNGTLVSMTSPIPEDGDKTLFANINVVTEKTQGLSLDAYMKSTKDFLPKYLTNYKLIAETPMTIDSLSAVLIEGSFSQGEMVFHNYQLIVIKYDKAYVVTGTTFDSGWTKNKDSLLSIIKSLKFDK